MQLFFIFLLIVLGIIAVAATTLAIIKKKKLYWSFSGAALLLVVGVSFGFYSWHVKDESYKSGDYEGAGASVESSSIPSDVVESNKEAAGVDDDQSSDTESDESTDKNTLFTLDDGTNVEKISSTTYSPEISDNSWGNGELYISKAYVAKTESFTYENNDYEGIIGIRYSFDAKKDSTIFDGQSKLSTSDGQEALRALDMPIGVSTDISDIDSGVSKNGEQYFFISDFSKPASIRWRFSAEDRNNDDADMKDFDITIPLKN